MHFQQALHWNYISIGKNSLTGWNGIWCTLQNMIAVEHTCTHNWASKKCVTCMFVARNYFERHVLSNYLYLESFPAALWCTLSFAPGEHVSQIAQVQECIKRNIICKKICLKWTKKIIRIKSSFHKNWLSSNDKIFSKILNWGIFAPDRGTYFYLSLRRCTSSMLVFAE